MPSLNYTPSPGFFGVDTLTYEVTNPDGGSDTAVVSITVDDTEPPGLSISSPTEGQVFPAGTTSLDTAGTAVDNDSVALVQARRDGGPWQTTAGTTDWLYTVGGLADGQSYDLEYRAQDPSGNWSTIESVTFSVAVDGTAPSIAITGPTGEQPAGTTSIDFVGTASDDISVASVRCRINGGPWETATGNVAWANTFTNLADGATYLLEAQSIDDGGNLSTIGSRSISINNPPTATVDSVTTDLDMSVLIDVLANDLNVDVGATLSIAVQGANGTAVVNP